MKRLLVAIIIVAWPLHAVAKGDYMSVDTFLALAFDDEPPAQQALWFNATQRREIKSLFGDEPRGIRQRYWAQGQRTAWILEEVGREKPITVGVAVNDGAITRVEILSFRESRGWEVRFPFFTEQFIGIGLRGNGGLTQHVDGITGATLSVRAVKKVARKALYLHRQTPYAQGDAPQGVQQKVSVAH